MISTGRTVVVSEWLVPLFLAVGSFGCLNRQVTLQKIKRECVCVCGCVCDTNTHREREIGTSESANVRHRGSERTTRNEHDPEVRRRGDPPCPDDPEKKHDSIDRATQKKDRVVAGGGGGGAVQCSGHA